MRGLKELRVKESDRLAATADVLRVNGVAVEIEGDDLIVAGQRPRGRRRRGRRPTWTTGSRWLPWSWASATENPVASTTALSSPPAFRVRAD